VLRFLLLALLLTMVARAFWRVIDGVLEGAGATQRSARNAPAVKLVRDPVCGTFVAPGTALSLTARGSTHYFCSDECRRKFSA
jgi:YHS domain-containing protein